MQEGLRVEPVYRYDTKSQKHASGSVAQLAEHPAVNRKVFGFKSQPGLHYLILVFYQAGVAQSVERETEDLGVGSSILFASTK